MLANSASSADSYVAFVTCPLLRDTPELPCWMAKYEGRLYYLGIQEGRNFNSTWYQPQLKHKMLVEAVVSSDRPICGGVPLKQLQVSTFVEISPECNTLLHSDNYISPEGRPAGPDRPTPPGVVPIIRDPPPGAPILYTSEDVKARKQLIVTVYYGFDSDFLIYPQQQNRVYQAQAYAKAIGATQLRLTAFRGATKLSNGRVLTENTNTLARRLANLREILAAFDVPTSGISVDVHTNAEPAHGQGDYLNRRVEITVYPGEANATPRSAPASSKEERP